MSFSLCNPYQKVNIYWQETGKMFFCQFFTVELSRDNLGEYNSDFTAGFNRSKCLIYRW